MRAESDTADLSSGGPPPFDSGDGDDHASQAGALADLPWVEALRRRLPWRFAHAAGIAASLALFALAAFILGRTLSNMRFADLAAAISATSGAQVLQAVLLTTLSYLVLTGYDIAALRQIGARAPYRVAALASFTSYAISFNLGFPIVTGAAVRFWIYSRAQLSALQVANLTLIAGLTFWLGMTAMIGVGLIAGASALSRVDGAPPLINFVIGAGVLAAIVYYVVWVALERRRLVVRGHMFELPGPGPTLAQLTLGIADLCCAAGALYVLLPQGQQLDFIPFVAIYVFACLLGVISHAPGGIGVFEATMLHAVSAASQESLLASLLLFRVIYYFLPFLLALAVLGADEGARRWSGLREAVARIMGERAL